MITPVLVAVATRADCGRIRHVCIRAIKRKVFTVRVSVAVDVVGQRPIHLIKGRERCVQVGGSLSVAQLAVKVAPIQPCRWRRIRVCGVCLRCVHVCAVWLVLWLRSWELRVVAREVGLII
jgi:hypothetical protein